MAQPTNNTALAIAIQPVRSVFTAPTLPADLMPISNLRPNLQGVSAPNDEYTGTVILNGEVVAGRTESMTFNVKLRGPGGEGVPAANAFLLGRILRAAKMAELRTAAAIPVAAEALGAGGGDTMAVLGAGAAATVGLYKGLALQLRALGTTYKSQLTAIRSYDADKKAGLVEKLSAAASGNYIIPPQLSYVRSVDSSLPPLLSFQTWFGGDRWDWVDAGVTGLRLVAPVSTNTQISYPELEVTIEGTVVVTAAEASPSIPTLGTIPVFKDGKQWLAHKAVGGSQFTLDLGITTERPPNPNQPSGADAPELTGSTARLSMTRQKYSKDVFDTLDMADKQLQHPFFAQWGHTAGNIVQVVVPDARFNFPNIDLGAGFVNETGDLLIDAFDRSVAINFPYGAALA